MIERRKVAVKTRKQLMQEINFILGTEHNWSRLNSLDLERLYLALKHLKGKIIAELKQKELEDLLYECEK